MPESYDPDVDPYVQAALGRKALKLVVIDVRNLTSIADVLILCSGRSSRQVVAIAAHIQKNLKDRGIRPLHVEGLKDGQWVLLDYGHVIMHVFHEPVRTFYDIEGLWSDAPRIHTPSTEPGEDSTAIDEETEIVT